MVFKKLKTHSMNYQDEDFGEIKNIIANYQHDDKLIKTTLKCISFFFSFLLFK